MPNKAIKKNIKRGPNPAHAGDNISAVPAEDEIVMNAHKKNPSKMAMPILNILLALLNKNITIMPIIAMIKFERGKAILEYRRVFSVMILEPISLKRLILFKSSLIEIPSEISSSKTKFLIWWCFVMLCTLNLADCQHAVLAICW